jgi:hypothetical protein
MPALRVAVLSLCCATSAAAAQLPYAAKVVVPQADVFSGPGRQHYPTDRLTAGQTVEVYRLEPGGWCAIRPPEGSFSWVEARFLAAAPNEDAAIRRVTADDVPSYIGGRFGPERSASSVRLRRDELVESLGEEVVGGKRWQKIAPPAGEFRWIEAAQIQEGSEVRHQGPRIEGSAASGQGSERASSSSTDPHPLTPQPGPVDDPRQLRAIVSNYTPAAHKAAASLETASQSPTENTVGDDLRRLEIRLSMMMAEDSSQWDIEGPRREAENLLDRAEDKSQREAVRALLAKLSRLDGIRQRSRGAKSSTPSRPALLSSRPALLPPRLEHDEREIADSPAEDESRYDGVGRLREVVTRNIAAAPFALVDENERVRTYVSPAPGVNLRAHVGQRVGIYGIEATTPPRGQRHLTAQRVMPLEQRDRR